MTVKVKYDFNSDGSLQYKSWRNEKGEAHREFSPALEWSNGTRTWHKNGFLHREDGPAVILKDGNHEYYLNGTFYTKEDYWKEIKRLKKERE